MKYRYSIQNGATRIKTNTKKYMLNGLAAIVIVTGISMPALASSSNNQGARGEVKYTALGLKRQAEFEVKTECEHVKDRDHDDSDSDRIRSEKQKDNKCVCASAWDVSGAWVINVNYLGVDYPEDLVLSQTASGLTGTLALVGGGSPWTITSGSVTGNSVEFDGFFNSNPSMTAHFSGTITPAGVMSGTWNDVTGGSRVGTWASTSGQATQSVMGCNGEGKFKYSDVNGANYKVQVKYVKVSGNDTWFAGPVTSGNVGAGQWLFAKVHDGGTPGSNGDQIWGSFTTENNAKLGVALMSTPTDGPFAITSGNIIVN